VMCCLMRLVLVAVVIRVYLHVLQSQCFERFVILSAHYIHRVLFSNCTVNEEYNYAMRNGITVRCINVVSVLTEMKMCVCVCVCVCVCARVTERRILYIQGRKWQLAGGTTWVSIGS
jgi:hypothetical protein